MDALVSLENLMVSFGDLPVLHGIDLAVNRGEALGLVGESGSGKSVTWLAALGLLPRHAVVSGEVLVDGEDICNAPGSRLEKIRGRRIAMIFQDPASSLNPVLTIGHQIGEALALHQGLSGLALRLEARRLLEQVGMPDAAGRLSAYPHELSGGQNQRAMIAMALAGKPALLVADEPTTALDATIQAQILDLLNEVRREHGMALVLISHDLGVVAENCDRVAVMYAGRIVEEAPASSLFEMPRHPYTQGLIGALPALDGPRQRLTAMAGTVPDPKIRIAGCSFAPRCSLVIPRCRDQIPELASDRPDCRVACINAGAGNRLPVRAREAVMA